MLSEFTCFHFCVPCDRAVYEDLNASLRIQFKYTKNGIEQTLSLYIFNAVKYVCRMNFHSKKYRNF